MGGRKYPLGHNKYVTPKQEAAKAKADADEATEIAKEKRDEAVKWYVDVLVSQSQLPTPCTSSRLLLTRKY